PRLGAVPRGGCRRGVSAGYRRTSTAAWEGLAGSTRRPGKRDIRRRRPRVCNENHVVAGKRDIPGVPARGCHEFQVGECTQTWKAGKPRDGVPVCLEMRMGMEIPTFLAVAERVCRDMQVRSLPRALEPRRPPL